jgi:hypothetical protein
MVWKTGINKQPILTGGASNAGGGEGKYSSGDGM